MYKYRVLSHKINQNNPLNPSLGWPSVLHATKVSYSIFEENDSHHLKDQYSLKEDKKLLTRSATKSTFCNSGSLNKNNSRKQIQKGRSARRAGLNEVMNCLALLSLVFFSVLYSLQNRICSWVLPRSFRVLLLKLNNPISHVSRFYRFNIKIR